MSPGIGPAAPTPAAAGFTVAFPPRPNIAVSSLASNRILDTQDARSWIPVLEEKPILWAGGAKARSAAVLPGDLVQIDPAVAQVGHRALGSRPGQVGQVQVGEDHRFDVLGRLRRHAVAGE